MCYLRPRDSQQANVMGHCELCGGELYEEETAYYDDSNGIYICDACLEKWAKQNLSEVRMGDDY